MLHIILLIFKIIGILLAAILGILVLLLCIVLFVPVKYNVQGDCKGNLETLDAEVKVSWFLHLISAYASYRDQSLEWQVRIGWKKLNSPTDEVPGDEVEEVVEEDVERPLQKIFDFVGDVAEERVREPLKEPLKEIGSTVQEEAEEVKKDGFRGKIGAVWRWIKSFFNKLKYTFHKICDSIESLIEKKDHILDFLTDEDHKVAFGRLKKEGFKLLKRLKPKRFHVNVHFGFDDPYRTGQVLAGCSMLYPFIGNNASIRPDFEKKILEGSLTMRGRVKVFYFVALGWNLIWNKEVRKTYRDIRSFQL